ncbi:MAG: aminotransferase class I/II-fold pyridoxal phosphate-dependent enzyme [Peptococcaceae bacterium]|jgi:cystathionine beta-lyase|nr:aminotransferase class I/II-fold pyridoxal phosphate-dependent enzyme [Peptococcaceae bacterium]
MRDDQNKSDRYDFDAGLDRRGTNCVKWDTIEEGYIPMSIADMDFGTPAPIIEAIRRRLDHPAFGYGIRNTEMVDAVIAWFGRTYDFELDRSWIVPLTGIYSALAFFSSLTDGDVLTATPNYPPILRGPERVDRACVFSPMKKAAETRLARYELDFEDLERKAAADVGMYSMCSPHNPIGRVYTKEELERLSDFARKRKLVVLSDEIHNELIYDHPHTPYLTVEGGLESSVTLISAGKTCNIPGIPAALAIVPDEALRGRVIAAASGFGGAGALNTEALRAAYAECDDWKKALVSYLKENRDYLETEFLRRFPKIRLTHTEGTYLQWVDFSGYGISNAAQWLLDHPKIVAHGGKMFGGAESEARINFGCPRSLIKEALDRMETSLTSSELNAV